VLYGELTILAIWAVLLAASARSGRDAVGTLLLATAPLLLGLFSAIVVGSWYTVRFSARFSVLRLPGVGVPIAYLVGGGIYVYCVRELTRGAVKVSGTMTALNWLPHELRYLLFVGMLIVSAWPLEWMAVKLRFWSWSGQPEWGTPFLIQLCRYYSVFVLGSILYAGILARLVGAPSTRRRD